MYLLNSTLKFHFCAHYDVEHAVKVAKEELTLECDYVYERESQLRMKAWTAHTHAHRLDFISRLKRPWA